MWFQGGSLSSVWISRGNGFHSDPFPFAVMKWSSRKSKMDSGGKAQKLQGQKSCWKCFFFCGALFSCSDGKTGHQLCFEKLRGLLSFFLLSLCKYQSVPQTTGHMKLVQPFSYSVCFQEMLGFATAVSLAAFDMEADTSAPAVPGPKSLWLGSSWGMWSWMGYGEGTPMCAPVAVNRHVFLLSSLG